MPPFLPRKRLRSPSPEAGPSKPTPKSKSKTPAQPRKRTLFDDLDAGIGKKRTAAQNKALLQKHAASDDDSSLSSLSDDDFEDVPNAKRQKIEDGSEDEDEDMEFEDVETNAVPEPSGPAPSGDLELTLTKDPRVSITNPLGTKKGPSKIERQIRVSTHQMHVQLLMFHNALRNAWLCDKELQDILVKQLSPGVQKEIERWKRNSGLEPKEEHTSKGKGKARNSKGKETDVRSQRDWGKQAEMQATGEVNMSRGDPLFRLLEVLIAFWKQRFRITAPGLRKLGYMSLQKLDEETKSFEKEDHDPERHGERIRDIEEFKECAKSMEGSRDVGAQLFTGLLRGLGLEARIVANLQPVGFGWSQYEEATDKNPRKLKKSTKTTNVEESSDENDSPQPSDDAKPVKPAKKGNQTGSAKPKKVQDSKVTSTRRRSRGTGLQDGPINLSDSDLSPPPESDEESVIDVTPAKKRVLSSLPYDRDLVAPNYWTEVLSPVTNTYTPVDPVVLHFYATNDELCVNFLPPPKSEKIRHITSYIIGHSSDGTAKDVTTRYLKGHMWPGRTKGYRLPIEKTPVYNRHGKVKRYEEYDWFKAMMSGYERGTKKCPRDEIDDHEEATALLRKKREKKEVEEGKESLQYYKSHPEFVLERHLKREEALLPTANHVKMFTIKGKGETTTEEKVFLRKDVVHCKTMETWHKEGRAPKVGEEPLKRVPYRAATTNRRRELAEAEKAAGEKVLQGLFSRDQTDWIIPPPIENGIIPKNNFGNIDLYVDSMLPEGAVHIPMRGTVKICKRLGIDYAEAVTGFEFGHRMAVPVITGVVIAEEHHDDLMDEWHKDEAERVRKEDEKKRKATINMWRKFLMGLRIVKRVKEEYGEHGGEEIDELNPWINKKKGKGDDEHAEAQQRLMARKDEDNAGGFFPEGHNEEPEAHQSSFFPVAQPDDDDQGGGFVIEDHNEEPLRVNEGQAYTTPRSLQSNFIFAAKQSAEEEDENMQDVKPELVATTSTQKRRGRPPGSINESRADRPTPTSKSVRATTTKPAKGQAAKLKTSSRRSSGRGKPVLEDSAEDDDDTDGLSSLSEVVLEEPDSDPEDQQPEAPPKRAPRKKATKSAASKTLTPRKTPKRSAAKKSETALKSHYFAHSDEDEDESE
ncbi:putative DNA repair protein rhp42 [Halenospora varia]|nr:putative DNA repair protein rhp42 [Halenospora varia]